MKFKFWSTKNLKPENMNQDDKRLYDKSLKPRIAETKNWSFRILQSWQEKSEDRSRK